MRYTLYRSLFNAVRCGKLLEASALWSNDMENAQPIEINDFDNAIDFAANYLRTYFCDEPVPDDQVLMRFLAQEYRKLDGLPVLLEVGCGPVINHVLSAVPFVSEIHMADYRSDNLQAISDWITNASDAHNWHRFTRFALEVEGQTQVSYRNCDGT